MDYMTLKEAGQKWNVTPRQVNYLCSGGRIPGAVKMAGVWLIPKTAEKPIDGRTKQGKGLHHTELSELQAELPDKWEYYIDRLSGYIASTGRKYKNHAATIRRWVADDTAKAAPKRGIPDYSYKEGESL